MQPETLVSILRDHGCSRLLAKRLAPNDNSKNQIYLGGDYSAIQLLPFGDLVEDETVVASSKRARLKASVSFLWIGGDGQLAPAPHANLILYPKYPEVRLSGLLRGASGGAEDVIVSRDEGRWLFLGITKDQRIIGYACGREDPCARWAEQTGTEDPALGVFRELPLLRDDSRQRMQRKLREIVEKGWIRSKRLDRDGAIRPCEAENCGGYTLEAEMDIRPNSRAEPDFDGWEVKQYAVDRLERPVGRQITLFTPEPDGGVYADDGVETFIRRYGYPDVSGIEDRLNFGGAHKFGILHPKTSLTLGLDGWDAATGKVTSLSGGIRLLDGRDRVAASWSFASLIDHWRRKHAKAVYVPSIRRIAPNREYRYGRNVLAGLGTEFPLVLRSVTAGLVIYDPGIKMEQASGKPAIKRRSQFRILFRNLGSLYHRTEPWDVCQ